MEAEELFYSQIFNLSPSELLQKFGLKNNSLDFVIFDFLECDENLEKLENFLKNLQVKIEKINSSNEFCFRLLSLERNVIQLRFLIKSFI